MSTEWVYRRNSYSGMPYQWWSPFPDEAIVMVKNVDGDFNVGPAKKFWWGWEQNNPEGVIICAKRLDKPKVKNNVRYQINK